MFKKFKDKLAEEVKSSPQRIQQFAQAAQAAVTSASSSISDITNTDLFSIGDSDSSNKGSIASNILHQESLGEQGSLKSVAEILEKPINQEENSRQRRLSNSSFASDISFRLPSYESPSMYHLQSDVDVSASEAEEKGFGSAINLDRVTKEQLYAAYRRTQDRFTKYKTQYADLARHYKLLERENAKARNVLVETQDKALRRISELREQCTLEQSAKAHLEKALRIEIEEKNMKIDSLYTKLKILQDNKGNLILEPSNEILNENKKCTQLIDLSHDENQETANNESTQSEVSNLGNKIVKMEQLINKYKESLKISKEKNAYLIAELQTVSTEIDKKNIEIEQLKTSNADLIDSKHKIDELSCVIEKMQNTHSTLEFTKNKEISILKLDFQNAQEEIIQLNKKIEGLSKREEEYAISLAENKLSIHKELESKEAEIKSLKGSLTSSQKEIQSLNIIIDNYRKSLASLEEEHSKFNNTLNDLNSAKTHIDELESQIQDVTQRCQTLEHSKLKLHEEYKCLQLQINQETAEKLAMIDRNVYLENRNTQLSDENAKKSFQINELESTIKLIKENEQNNLMFGLGSSSKEIEAMDETKLWKSKYIQLESEIQEEREELIKLQMEIEKLLANHEAVQTENMELNREIAEIKTKNEMLEKQTQKLNTCCNAIFHKIKSLQQFVITLSRETKLLFDHMIIENKAVVQDNLALIINKIIQQEKARSNELQSKNDILQKELQNITAKYEASLSDLNAERKEIEKLKINIQQIKEEEDKIKQISQSITHKHNDKLNEIMQLQNDKQRLNSELQQKIKEHNNFAEKLAIFQKENAKLLQTIKHIQDKLEKVESENLNMLHLVENTKIKYEQVVEENNILQNKIKELDKNNMSLEKEKQYLFDRITENEECKKRIENENSELLKKYQHIEEEVKKKINENHNFIKKIDDNEEYLVQINKEKENVQCEIKGLKERNNEIETNYKNLLKSLEDAQQKNSAKECEQNTLYDKINFIQDAKTAIEIDNENITSKNLSLEKDNQNLLSKIKDLEKKIFAHESENEILLKDINKIKETNVSLNNELNIMRKRNEEDLNKLEALNSHNINLSNIVKDYDNLKTYLNQLEVENKNLKQENILLKQQSEIISDNVRKLEKEMIDVRNSRTEIEKEKDNLNTIIKKLENNENTLDYNRLVNHIQNQISNDDINKCEDILTDDQLLQEKVHENNCTGDISERKSDNLDTISLKYEYEIIKEENRRLRSDIEGLQTYLTKISKENSNLNDKLREVISSSDHIMTEGSELYNLEELKKEIQLEKDKISNLTRENILLTEENLELKDQLNTQTYNIVTPKVARNDIDTNLTQLETKYYNTLETKKELEEKLRETEQINLTISDSFKDTHANNEKLRLCNEKLERRLDEALVSLRHLHALQENTELEYLRNILFEYLTGSGTHSVTLAKVLSAVVKFNDSQTEIVLQKEKERQGFLRQLGII